MTYEEQVQQGRTSPKGEVKREKSYQKLLHVIAGSLILAVFTISIYFLSEEGPYKKHTQPPDPPPELTEYMKFSLELEGIKNLSSAEIEYQIEELNSAYSEVKPFDRDRIKTKLVHLKFQKEILKLREDNSNRSARSELYRLKNIHISIPLPEYKDEYKKPEDLYWGFFLNRNEIVVSQTPREHYSNNGLLARDIATSGLALKVRAPDLYNKELTWDIEAKDNLKGTGKTLILTSKDKQYQVLVGHIHSWNGKTTAKTGEVIAIVGGDKGAIDEGISTGRHIHAEYRFFDKYKKMYTPFIYDFGPMNWHPEVNSTSNNGATANNNNEDWYISSYYTPVKDQKKYHAGGYEEDLEMNTQGNPFVTADGTSLTNEYKNKILACPPSVKFGTKVKITMPSNHPEHPGEVLIATCHDRGGKIKSKRLDLWAGIGDDAWIGEWASKKAKVEFLK